jgi:hypothetical protein
MKGNEMTGGWRKLHNKDLHNFYSPQKMIRMLKSMRMSLVGKVSRMGGVKECM